MLKNLQKFNNQRQSGFTLIEVVVYLGLFAMLFGGAVLTAYNVIESSGRNQTRAYLQEEGDFILSKVNWVVSGSRSIDLPAVGVQGSTLQMSKYDGSNATISPNNTDIEIQTVLGNFLLNGAYTKLKVNSLKFTHQSNFAGSGINPDSVKTEFTLTAITPSGNIIEQDFSSITYLRK